jgi:N-acetyl-gamma-glutamyl-phosphate/LysW-gamma-L-alpha-aminoadipyl-6-phosphate reductase
MKVGVVGGSGYTGGELLRLLAIHSEVEISCVTSRKYAGKLVSDIHPNLRDFIDLRFTGMNLERLKDVDVVFLCLPHMVSMKIVNQMFGKTKIIDLSADFRIRDVSTYEKYYTKHECPELIKKAVYGLPEIHREEIKNASLIANPGCNSTAVILGLYPLRSLLKKSKIIIDVKEGSSASGRTPKLSNIHAERSNIVRIYKPKNHRHLAEIRQELGIEKICMSAHAVGMTRGIFASCHISMEDLPTEKDLWKLYRKTYSDEPFIRIVKKKTPPYNLPDIKGVVYSNFCEVGFVVDEDSERIVVFSALDNLLKGASGQAIQNMNIMFSLKETLGLRIPGFYV